MKRKRRGLTFEQVEPRIVLSGSTGLSEAVAVGGGVSSQAYLASDDVRKAANDLGVIHGSTSFNEYVGRFDERDLFRFVLEDDAEVDITLDRGGTDAEIFLLDENRFSIRNTEPVWQRGDLTTALSAGEYLVKVQRKGVVDSNYTLNVIATMAPSGPPADIAGNTFDDALDLGILTTSQTFHDFVGASDSADAFQFEVTTESDLAISATGLTGDADIYLFDGNRQRVGQSQQDGLSDEFLALTIPAGVYTAAVAPHLKADSYYSITFAADGSLVAPTPGGVTPLPDVPDFGAPATEWNLNAVNAPEAWAAGFTGAGVTVAIVDTGIQLDHIDLGANIWLNPGEIAGDNIDNDGNGYVDDINGWDFVSNDNDPTDDEGHGTHVAGTVAALHNGAGATGVAYDAELMAVKVLDDVGIGSWLSISQGIRYAVENGADVINLSLGGPVASSAILSALQFAQQHDVFVVAASGNESALVPGYPASHASSLPNVLSVGAFDDTGRLAGFSPNFFCSLKPLSAYNSAKAWDCGGFEFPNVARKYLSNR